MMSIQGFVLLCTLAVLGSVVAATDLNFSKDKEPYMCLNTDICDRKGTPWQWCDEEVEGRCRDCSEVENFCGTSRMPKNCTWHCTERALQMEKVKECRLLKNITHGHHNATNTGTMHGDVIELKCEAGYQCQGQCIATCGDYGQYTHLLSCIENHCSTLPMPKDGKYSPEKPTYKVNDMINFTCDYGFTLTGSKSAKCTQNGTWSIKQYPACILNQKGQKIENGLSVTEAVCIGVGVGLFISCGIGLIVGCCICCKYDFKRKVEDKKDKTNSDKKDKVKETKPLIKESRVTIEDEEVQYSKPPHSHSDSDLSRDPLNSGKGYKRQNSVSENDITSRAGQGTDSGVPTSNPSKESDLNEDSGESSKGQSLPFNVTFHFNNFNNNTNTNQQNNTVPERSSQSNDEDIEPAENKSKIPMPDKYPTEETRNRKNECRAELQDGTHVEDTVEGEGAEAPTVVKQVPEEINKDDEPRTRFPVLEQQKFPPDRQFHNQPDDDDTAAKLGKVAIGSRSIDHGDINGH